VAGIWWLASYEKSGNTWLRVVLANLLSGRPVDINAMPSVSFGASDRALFDKALGIASADLTIEQETNLLPRAYEIWAAELQRPLYSKTHDAYRMTPAGEPLFPATATRGAVYVVRDPRAVAVSFANHRGRDIDDTIDRMENREAGSSASIPRLSQQLFQRPGHWSDHVESWLGAPFPVHLVRYEDMHNDPHATFAAVARFLDLSCDSERIAAAVEAAAFPRLQAQERAAGFIEKPSRSPVFFREGRVDGWRQVLTAEQATRIVAANKAVMQRLGYDITTAPLPRVPAPEALYGR
jgi:aryl sulfotransferase